MRITEVYSSNRLKSYMLSVSYFRISIVFFMFTPFFLNLYSKAESKHGEHKKNYADSELASGHTLPPAELAEIREVLKTLVEDESIPSVAVGAALNGEIIWQEAFGLADLENQRYANANTMYSI